MNDFVWRTVVPTCPCCGAESPGYVIKDINGNVLGCETCLTVIRDGVIQI